MLEALTRAPTADWLGHRWGAADSAPDVADFGYKLSVLSFLQNRPGVKVCKRL